MYRTVAIYKNMCLYISKINYGIGAGLEKTTVYSQQYCGSHWPEYLFFFSTLFIGLDVYGFGARSCYTFSHSLNSLIIYSSSCPPRCLWLSFPKLMLQKSHNVNMKVFHTAPVIESIAAFLLKLPGTTCPKNIFFLQTCCCLHFHRGLKYCED